jgi:alkyl sulfatase BDS1-like metallo-beta-lactamase superfamily hydrolase
MRRAFLPLFLALSGCSSPPAVETASALPAPELLAERCEALTQKRIVEVVPGQWVARGYGLANTILIATDEGHVVVDPGMVEARAAEARAALQAKVPGPIHSLIYTHSHIDHVGAAEAWSDEDTAVLATDAFREGFFHQYGVFRDIETIRGARQFARHVPPGALGCSAIGEQVDIEGARSTGMRLPTKTFAETHKFTVGGVDIELHAAPGETPDQLFVWLPGSKTLLPGDNLYAAFPNLYTIRGTRPRPVSAWIRSLDAMRALDPEVLIPSHTEPIVGRDAVRKRLRDYRDAIQWVRDEVVRGANAGLSQDAIAERVRLPKHLADLPELKELYGQVDWSARAIYDANLGWFDGRPHRLYPLPRAEAARRSIALMGGVGRVTEEAGSTDPAWALELYALLEDAGHPTPGAADAMRAQAQDVFNTNGRGYLLESAWERENKPDPLPPLVPSADLLAGLPLDTIFDSLPPLLDTAAAGDTTESVVLELADEGQTWRLTLRRGVLEVHEGAPLPGTPEPVATVQLTASTWRALSLKATSPLAAITDGTLSVDHPLAFRRFMGRIKPPE